METFKPENYYKPTPKKWLKLGMAIKGFLATVGGSSFVAGHETLGFCILILAGLINETINFFTDEN